MKPQEKALLLAIYRGQAPFLAVSVTGNTKQNVFYLEKWAHKGWYEYGVNVCYGWLTKEGQATAQQLEAQEVTL